MFLTIYVHSVHDIKCIVCAAIQSDRNNVLTWHGPWIVEHASVSPYNNANGFKICHHLPN